MSIDVVSLTNTMIAGVRRSIGERWSAIRAVAEPELRKLAQTLEDVQKLVNVGEMQAGRRFVEDVNRLAGRAFR